MTRSKLAPAIAACALTALAGCSPSATEATKPAPSASAPTKPTASAEGLPAGDYVIDKSHASLLFRVDHLGFSHYVGRFTAADAKLKLDPAKPETANLEVTIDPASIAVESPPPGFLDHLRGKDFLDTKAFPAMTFRSTRVEKTGPDTAKVHGDLTLHGVTRPVTLETTFNGGYVGHPMDPNARIGFSAHGTLKRSEFGIGYGIPAPGSTMGVSDAVEILIEAEFTGPPMAKATPAT